MLYSPRPFTHHDPLLTPTLYSLQPFTHHDPLLTPTLYSPQPFNHHDPLLTPTLYSPQCFTHPDPLLTTTLYSPRPFTHPDPVSDDAVQFGWVGCELTGRSGYLEVWILHWRYVEVLPSRQSAITLGKLRQIPNKFPHSQSYHASKLNIVG